MLFQQTGGLFLAPIKQATGWNTTTATIVPIATLLFGLCSPAAAWLATRRGPRFAAVLGLAVVGVLFLIVSAIPLRVSTYYLLAALIGIFGSLTYLVPYTRTVAFWFTRGTGKALGIVGSGASWVPILATPLVAYTIYTYSWRAGYLILAAVVLVVALPAAVLALREPPRDAKPAEIIGNTTAPAATAGDAAAGSGTPRTIRTVRYWLIVAPVVLVALAGTGFTQSTQSLLLEDGRSKAVATTMTTLFFVGMLGGRVIGGILLDLFSRYVVGIGMFALGAAGCLLLANVHGLPVIVIACAVIATGSCVGAEGDFLGYFLLREYGRKRFTSAFGVSQAAACIGGFVGPLLFSSLQVASGGYVLSAYVGAAMVLASILVLIIVRVTAPAQAGRSS